MMYTSYFKSPVGLWAVIGDETSVYYIKPVDRVRTNQHSPATQAMCQQLAAWFAGTRRQLDVPVVLTGTAFQQDVYRALGKVPYGSTVSYKQLAAMAGHPQGYRAVGQALSKNPLLIAVPCHRVIEQDGSLGGFALGTAAKKRILAVEHPLTDSMKKKLKGWL